MRDVKIYFSLWIGIIMAGVVIYCSFIIIGNSHDIKRTNKELEKIYREDIATQGLVSLNDISPEDSTTSLAEKVEIIRANQINIINRQAELINDFRQEMNNNVNKMNSWLTFAIGMMSLVGVIIPVLLQVKFHVDDKVTLKEYKEELEKQYTKENSLLLQQINIDTEKLKTETKALNDEVRDYKKAIGEETLSHKLWAETLSFTKGIDNNILNNQPDRNLILRYTWVKISNSFCDVLKICLQEKNICEDKRSTLFLSLLMIYAAINKLKSFLQDRKLRKLNEITDLIRNLLPKIEAGVTNPTAWAPIRESLTTLDSKIQKISTEVL